MKIKAINYSSMSSSLVVAANWAQPATVAIRRLRFRNGAGSRVCAGKKKGISVGPIAGGEIQIA
jgi:hypothetical protein